MNCIVSEPLRPTNEDKTRETGLPTNAVILMSRQITRNTRTSFLKTSTAERI